MQMIEADLHIHSCYSFDSILSPRSIVRTALKKGLSAVAIADHNTVKGALRTKKEAVATYLIVIPGVELKTEVGDIMGLFVETNIKAREIDEVLDEIKEHDGLAVLLHPARRHVSNLEETAKKIDIVEALNGRTSRSRNLEAERLALRYNKPFIAGSDAHLGLEIGCVRTVFEDTPNTLEDVRRCIIKGKRNVVGKESPYIVHALSFGTQIAKYILRSV
jgi:predicted metal-dependent phosphoesterase TrpH